MWEAFINKFNIDQVFWAFDLILAAILGFLIGLERKRRDKEAGIKTHTIVAFGSALMMLISRYAFGDGADTARVAAQIVAGIGFLGSGIIVYKKNIVSGLTTAAGVWTTAGIGMACGGGLYIIAIISTGVLILIHLLLHKKIFKNKRTFAIRIVFMQCGMSREKVKELFNIDRYDKLVVERKDDNLIYQATLKTDKEYSSLQIDEIMENNPFIQLIERCDDN